MSELDPHYMKVLAHQNEWRRRKAPLFPPKSQGFELPRSVTSKLHAYVLSQLPVSDATRNKLATGHPQVLIAVGLSHDSRTIKSKDVVTTQLPIGIEENDTQSCLRGVGLLSGYVVERISDQIYKQMRQKVKALQSEATLKTIGRSGLLTHLEKGKYPRTIIENDVFYPLLQEALFSGDTQYIETYLKDKHSITFGELLVDIGKRKPKNNSKEKKPKFTIQFPENTGHVDPDGGIVTIGVDFPVIAAVDGTLLSLISAGAYLKEIQGLMQLLPWTCLGITMWHSATAIQKSISEAVSISIGSYIYYLILDDDHIGWLKRPLDEGEQTSFDK